MAPVLGSDPMCAASLVIPEVRNIYIDILVIPEVRNIYIDTLVIPEVRNIYIDTLAQDERG